MSTDETAKITTVNCNLELIIYLWFVIMGKRFAYARTLMAFSADVKH